MIVTPTALYVIASVTLLVGLVYTFVLATRTYMKYAGKSVVTCPETHLPAAVHIDVKRTVLNLVQGKPLGLRLDSCSSWPEREHCGQECLSQIANDPDCCHVTAMARHWFRDRHCAYCGKPIEQLHWHDHCPALLGPDNVTTEWKFIAPQDLPAAFENAFPVCWSCHIAETFRREHPELIVNRPWNRGSMGQYTPDDRN